MIYVKNVFAEPLGRGCTDRNMRYNIKAACLNLCFC